MLRSDDALVSEAELLAALSRASPIDDGGLRSLRPSDSNAVDRRSKRDRVQTCGLVDLMIELVAPA